MSENETNPLWAFSLRTYSDRRVQQVCLLFQDQFAADVNVLLLIMWLAISGKTLTETGAEEISQVSASWQTSVLRPLRMLRRNLSAKVRVGNDPDLSDFLRQLKDFELGAERSEQLALDAAQANSTRSSTGERVEAASIGFALYALQLGVTFPSEDLAILLAALVDPPFDGPRAN